MSSFSPDSSSRCSLKDIFEEMISAVDSCTEGGDEGDVNAKEKHMVSPELIAYLKWRISVIYTAAQVADLHCCKQ